jgi:hypothetical protein
LAQIPHCTKQILARSPFGVQRYIRVLIVNQLLQYSNTSPTANLFLLYVRRKWALNERLFSETLAFSFLYFI